MSFSIVSLPQAWIYLLILFLFTFSFERFSFSHPTFFCASSRTIKKDNWHAPKAGVVLGILLFVSFIVVGFDSMTYHLMASTYFFLSAFNLKSTSLFTNRTENYLGMTYFFGSLSRIHNYWNSVFLKAQIQKTARPIKEWKNMGKYSYGYVGLNTSILDNQASSYKDVVNNQLVTGFNRTDVISQSQLIAKTQHSVILIDDDSELYCYRIYHEVAGGGIIVIDLFSESAMIVDGENGFVEPLAYLLEYKCGISDESIVNISGNDQLFKEMDMSAVNINMNLSEYIGSALNKDWSENQDYYPKMQKELQNNGFFEMNTLLRQMREGGSFKRDSWMLLELLRLTLAFLLGC